MCAPNIDIYYQSETMATTTWENNNKPMSHQTRYGISNNTAIYNIDTHELHPTQSIKDNQIDIYISFSTFDSEFIILQYENQIGKFSNAHKISVKQLVRIKTHFPISKCHLQYMFRKAQHKDALIGYLIDIYSNIYTVNFSKYIDYYKTIGAQPIKYVQMFKNIPTKDNENLQNLHLQTPLFIYKDDEHLFTINLGGQLKIIKYNSQKSIIKEVQQYDVLRWNFQVLVLAAFCNKTKNGYLMVVVLHNGRAPYLFVNCRTVNDFKQQYHLQNQNNDQDSIEEVSYVAFDPKNNCVIVSLVCQKIQIYQISQITKHKSENKVYYLQRIFGFFINNHLQFHNLNIDYNIQHIHINKGVLMITTCKQFILYDIKDRIIKKKLQNNNLNQFKYGKIIDNNDIFFSCALIKGFNHINQNQSKIGKPNIHFVLYQFTKNKIK